MAEENQPGIGVKFPPLLLAVGVGAIGAWLWRQSRQPLPTTEAMAGRVCVVTGANAGIGKATAMALAQQGAHVVLACRSTKKGNAATKEIRRRLPGANMQVMPLDLESIDSIRGFVKVFSESKLPLHVLINNAGMMTAKPETVRGMEKTMVVNHLGPFLLTMLLLPNLRRSAAPNPEDKNQPVPASRIINVASRLEKRGQLLMANDPATPAGTAWFKPPPGEHSMLGQYGTSKLCNMLFTFELHRRLAAATAPASNSAIGRVTVNAVTPGLVNTNLGDNAFSPWLRNLIRLPMAPIKSLFFRNVDKGAETVTWAASSPAVEHSSGQFYGDMAEAACSKTSHDPELARKLWEASEAATGLNESERVV